MPTSTLYPARFAGPRRASAVAATVIAAASGAPARVEWSRDLKLAAGTAPRDLLVGGGRVIVVSPGSAAAYSPDGELRWEQTKAPQAPAALANGRMYFTDGALRLVSVDAAAGGQRTDVPFPGLPNTEHEVLLLVPRERDFVATTYLASATFDDENPSVAAPKPLVLGRRAEYGKAIGSWGDEWEARLRLPPLFLPRQERWLVAGDEVISVDLRTKAEAPRFRLPLPEVTEWSADDEGLLCVTGSADGRNVLAAVTTSGEEKWRFTDGASADRWAKTQPPVRGPGGRVHVLTEGRVLAIDAGKLVWQHDARTGRARTGAATDDVTGEIPGGLLAPESRLRHGTTTADGALLVAGGATLLLLDAAGSRVYSVDVGGEILTPPVVDSDGAVYVATASKLVKIR